jgi:hypothetical protein
MTSKIIEIELRFDGDGTVRQIGRGGFSGRVSPPTPGQEIRYLLHRTIPDPEDGLLNPEPGEPGVEGTFQLNISGTAHGFRELGRYFLALAELDSSVDPGHHQHFDGVRSEDGRTVVDIIVRKGPGDGDQAV